MYQESLLYEPKNEPLAARLRPQSLDDIIGQEHLIGPGKILRHMIENDQITSMIFWGPPGVGKTTLAHVIALQTKAAFINFSAVTSGIKEIKEVMKQADDNRRFGVKTIVFVDEIHRFNKAQQDYLLPFVEASGQHSESTKTAAARLPEAWAWDSNNITSGTFYPWLLRYRQILYCQ